MHWAANWNLIWAMTPNYNIIFLSDVQQIHIQRARVSLTNARVQSRKHTTSAAHSPCCRPSGGRTQVTRFSHRWDHQSEVPLVRDPSDPSNVQAVFLCKHRQRLGFNLICNSQRLACCQLAERSKCESPHDDGGCRLKCIRDGVKVVWVIVRLQGTDAKHWADSAATCSRGEQSHRLRQLTKG